jgi:hypothetical protein
VCTRFLLDLSSPTLLEPDGSTVCGRQEHQELAVADRGVDVAIEKRAPKRANSGGWRPSINQRPD